MSAIAGQTAGPNKLNFFRKPIDSLWVTKAKFFFSKIVFFKFDEINL